jgi:ubiquitin carboxyl-terminal hydrolase 9/24
LEIKDTEIDSFKTLINENLYQFTKAFTSEHVALFIEDNQLTLALKFLRSPYLEKRVKAVIEVKEVLERTELPKGRPKSRETMIKWLRDNRILESLLVGDSIHPELIKRCTDLAVFLCKNNAFPSKLRGFIYQLNSRHDRQDLAEQLG